MKLFERIAGMINPEAGRTRRSPTVSWANRIDHCPNCGRELTGHLYSLLASDVIDRKEGQQRLIEFFESLKSHDWRKLLTFQQWEGVSDNVELFGILCGPDSVVLVVIRRPFELYDNDEILAIEALGEVDSKSLLGLVKDKNWKTIE